MLLAGIGVLAAAAAFTLYLVLERQGPAGIPLALLRAVAWGAVAALLADPAVRHVAATGPVVLLDASQSMTDPGGDARWRAALDTVRRICGSRCAGRVLAFGAEPRLWTDSVRPDAPSSLLLPALREGAARGGPLVVVTDGEVDDAAALPPDLLHAARIVLLPRPAATRPDAGIAALDLPAALRAGDTARATVDVAARGAGPADTATLELLEQGRVVARRRVALGEGGVARRELAFVPAPAAADHEIRRYEARLTGLARDAEPRDDAQRTAAVVSRGPTVALVSDSPDWDFRWLSQTLVATSGVPVLGWVRTSPQGGWRELRTLKPVPDAEVRSQLGRATLVVLHGTAAGIATLRPLARGALLEWPVSRAATPGDWYVTAAPASPVGGALAGVSPDSLPPLESVAPPADSAQWTGLSAQQGRRGPARPVLEGTTRPGGPGRRLVRVGGTGLWRWASRGGAAAEAYRSLVAATADWLLEERSGAPPGLLALRDSLARGTSEFLPRAPSLHAQAGEPAAAYGEPVPLRHAEWVYFVAIGALVLEWIARRRRGLR